MASRIRAEGQAWRLPFGFGVVVSATALFELLQAAGLPGGVLKAVFTWNSAARTRW